MPLMKRKRRAFFWILAAVLLLLPSGIPAAGAQDEARPLPELEGFLQGVRQNLRSDRLLQSQYTYVEEETQRELDGKGKVKKIETRTYEVYPSMYQGLTYRRLVARDGVALAPKELEKQDREFDKKSEKRRREVEKRNAAGQAQREGKQAEARLRERAVIDEMLRMFEITMTGREQMDGLPVIALEFKPRPKFKAELRETKMLSKMSGKAWFSEGDYNLVRIEANLIGNISIGWGLLAKLHKGATAVFQRKLVNDEIWLPAESRFTGTGRIMLLKGLKIDSSNRYSDYRKFTVASTIRYGTPEDPP